MRMLSVLIESEKKKRDDPSQKRTIISKFLNYKDKEKVLREYNFGRKGYIEMKTLVRRQWK